MNNFDNIYEENYPKMYSVALNMINDRDAVRDIIQDIFIYYHKISKNGNTINRPKSWLMRATINKCIDYSKEQKKYLKIDSIAPIPIIEDSTEKKQEKEIIKQALARLKPKERVLAILYRKLNEILKKMDYEMY